MPERELERRGPGRSGARAQEPEEGPAIEARDRFGRRPEAAPLPRELLLGKLPEPLGLIASELVLGPLVERVEGPHDATPDAGVPPLGWTEGERSIGAGEADGEAAGELRRDTVRREFGAPRAPYDEAERFPSGPGHPGDDLTELV